jgi:hypothetical protein
MITLVGVVTSRSASGKVVLPTGIKRGKMAFGGTHVYVRTLPVAEVCSMN